MAYIGLNEPNLLNCDLAIQRIINDKDSDFIFAPHLDTIFEKNAGELFELLCNKLKSGKYSPSLPITIEVVKSSGFGRPGSILFPLDRLAYQLFVDHIAPIADKELNRDCVFSNTLAEQNESGEMFNKSHVCYKRYRDAIQKYSKLKKFTWAVKADISSFFERIYQHTLVNSLRSSGADDSIITALEKLLSEFTQKNSHGIIQGVYPSDFLGNFYLCSIDAEHELKQIKYVRYVDDMIIFFDNFIDAAHHKITLGSWLRNDGLNLNENKTRIYKMNELIREENEIDELFENAKEETHTIIDSIYGELELDSVDDIDMEHDAVKRLFDLEEVSLRTREKIDNFCIPVFRMLGDDYPAKYILSSFIKRPHMARLFSKYMGEMIGINEDLRKTFERLSNPENKMFDFQKMWLYSALLEASSLTNSTVQNAVIDLKNFNRHVALRAVCAVLIGRYGSASHKRMLRNHYSEEQSDYVKSAILFSSQYFNKDEKNACLRAWSNHNETNALISLAIKKS